MGNCGGGATAYAKENREIEAQLKRDKSKIVQEIRLLLLGAGESGKSTIAKQMKIIHLDGFDDEERAQWRSTIHQNVFAAIKALVAACEKLDIEIEEQNLELAESVKPFAVQNQKLTKSMAETVKTLWADKGIKEAYQRSSEFQLNDSAAYFFSEIDRLVGDFMPSDEDILRARVTTVGIAEMFFAIENISFRMVDVGGQRSERKKWIHCFQDVTAIIFCVALSEYDLCLAEESNVNRMWESLKLFDEIVNIQWFAATSVILFLNKKDLFQEKIKRVPLTVCFKDYTGAAGDVEAAEEYVCAQFVSKKKDPNKQLFAHITIATNTDNIRLVFKSVTNKLLEDTFQKLGF